MHPSDADSRATRGADSDYPSRRVRIEVTARQYWELRALLQSTGRDDDVGEAVRYLAGSLYDGLERPGSWEADTMGTLFEEWPFAPPVRTGSVLTGPIRKRIEFDIADIVHTRLEQFALTSGAENMTALLEHVVMVVCNGMEGPADWTLRLFGKWPRPKELWCAQCHAALFDERDLVLSPDGDLCPSCVSDRTCSDCGEPLTGDEVVRRVDGAFVVEIDGPLCKACRGRAQ